MSSTVLLYLQPVLLAELAKQMHWQAAQLPCAPSAMHFAGYSAGSYTAIALEADYSPTEWAFPGPLGRWYYHGWSFVVPHPLSAGAYGTWPPCNGAQPSH